MSIHKFSDKCSMAFYLLIKNLFINIVLIIMTSGCVLFSNFLILETKSIHDNFEIAQSIKNKNTILYMGRGMDLSQINDSYTIGSMNYAFFKTNEKMHFYTHALVENMDIPLSKGSWEIQPKKIGNTVYYPIVINKETSAYKYGETANMEFKNGTSINIYICGVLDTNQKYINLTMSTNVATANHFIKECEQNDVFFFGIEEVYPSKVTHGNQVYGCATNFIFFDVNLSNEKMQENYVIMRNQGFAYTLDMLMENSRENLLEHGTEYLPLLLCLILLSIVGVISFTVLSVKNNHSYYSCFLLCGGTKRDCMHLSLFNIGWIIAVSIFAVLFITQLLVNSGSLDGWHELSIVNVLASLALYGFVLAVGFLVTRLLFRNKTVTQLLKEDS